MVMGGKRRSLFWVIGGAAFIVVGLFSPDIVRMTFIMIGVIWAAVGLMLLWFGRSPKPPSDGAPPPPGQGWVQ